MSQPLTLDAKGLATLLHKSESTILRDVTRCPQSLPPSFKSGKKTLWFRQVAIAWMAAKSNELVKFDLTQILAQIVASAIPVPAPATPSRPPPMPSIAEMLLSASAGS